jgi:hypothetical protein
MTVRLVKPHRSNRRGGPPWPPLRRIQTDSQNNNLEFGEHNLFHEGAATEGRPYGTFRGLQSGFTGLGLDGGDRHGVDDVAGRAAA